MSIIAWLLLGLVAGFVGSKIVSNGSQGILGDIIVGIAGAFLGGMIFQYFGEPGITGLNLWSIVVAAVGSVVLLVPFYMFRGRSQKTSDAS